VRQQYPSAHPYVAYVLTVEAKLMAASGAGRRAAIFAGEAVAMYVALADQNAEKAIRARLLLGEILQSLGRNSEAKPQFESALVAAEATTPIVPTVVAHAEADLARVDGSLSEYAAAARFRAEAEASLAEVPAGPDSERAVTVRMLASASVPTKL
jgi:hypothetical protein